MTNSNQYPQGYVVSRTWEDLRHVDQTHHVFVTPSIIACETCVVLYVPAVASVLKLTYAGGRPVCARCKQKVRAATMVAAS
jgi:hypothetical protein